MGLINLYLQSRVSPDVPKLHIVWTSCRAHARGVQGLEKYLMTKIYHKTFGVSELDRERDEALSLRMAALSFIQPKHLDIPELYSDEKAWQLAIKELHKINNYKARFGGMKHLSASATL